MHSSCKIALSFCPARAVKPGVFAIWLARLTICAAVSMAVHRRAQPENLILQSVGLRSLFLEVDDSCVTRIAYCRRQIFRAPLTFSVFLLPLDLSLFFKRDNQTLVLLDSVDLLFKSGLRVHQLIARNLPIDCHEKPVKRLVEFACGRIERQRRHPHLKGPASVRTENDLQINRRGYLDDILDHATAGPATMPCNCATAPASWSVERVMFRGKRLSMKFPNPIPGGGRHRRRVR